MLRKDLEHTVLEYTPINERICKLRLKGKYCNISLLSVHAPTEEKDDEEKDQFYGLLEQIYDSLPRYDTKLILGDLNAKIGREEIFRPAIGKESLHEASNDNGVRIISFALDKGLRIMSTVFHHRRIYKETWISPDQLTRNQIDHVLIDHRHSSHIMDVRSYRGASCDSDHFLVITKYRQKLITIARTNVSKAITYNVEKLKIDETRQAFRENLRRLRQNLEVPPVNNCEARWKNLKEAFSKSAQEVLGPKDKSSREHWYDAECQAINEQKNKARMQSIIRPTRQSLDIYRELRKKAKKLCRRKKREQEKKRLAEVEEEYKAKNSRKFFRAIGEMRSGFQPRNNYISDEDGNLISDQNEVLERWANYFEGVLGGGTEARDCREVPVEPADEMEDEEVPPDIEEIIDIISDLKNNKAPGNDGVHAEMLKHAGADVWEEIYQIIFDVWMAEKMPEEWEEALVCPIYKKGNRLDCKNYRGISLLSTVYKLFSIAISRRLTKWAESIIGEYQSGFRQGRSTTDHIFSVRQMLEKTYEHNVTLYHLFIDFKQAYDSVDRGKMYEVLRQLGIPRKLVRLVQVTLGGTKCKVKCGARLSRGFNVHRGLRQGDPLSTVLFNLVLEAAIRRIRTNPGGTIYTRLTQHLAYADDVLLSARTKAALAGALEEFLGAAKDLGLEMNTEKTMFMKTSRNGQGNAEIEEIGEHRFKVCRDFKYLGSIMSSDGNVVADMKARIAAGSRCLYGVQRLLRFKALSRKAKLLIYKTIVRPTVTYGCETWPLTKECKNSLQVWERKVLRKIFGPIKVGDVWLVRRNRQLQELFGEPDIVSFIQLRRLKWLGHVERMDPERLPRKMMYGKPGGSRRRGRPRLRWLDDVEGDLQALGVRRWRRLAADRDGWNSLLAEALVLHGL